MKREVDLIIFDWDGTLMDSAGHIVSAMQLAIADLALPPRRDEQIRELIGLGLNDAFARLYPELDTQATLRLLAEYRQRFLNPPVAAAALFEGVRDTLSRLGAEGYRLAVATGKSRRGLDRALLESELGPLFCSSRCADECASKPDPQMLQEILADCDIAPSRALMVGDTEYDMAMARTIRMPAVGVACGVHDAARLRQAGAAAVLESIRALPSWLGNSYNGGVVKS